MSNYRTLPSIPDEYDSRIFRQILSDIERNFSLGQIRLNEPQVVNAATGSIQAGVDVVYVDSTATATGGVTINIGSASTLQYQQVRVKDRGDNAATNNITINAATGETINGTGSYVISTDNKGILIVSDGSNWNVFD